MAVRYEKGWVIEHKESAPPAALYWAGDGWDKDHTTAIRYARKIDAERAARGLPNEPGDHRISEHSWLDVEWGTDHCAPPEFSGDLARERVSNERVGPEASTPLGSSQA